MVISNDLLVDSEGTDQIVQMCSQIWAFTTYIFPMTHFHMARPIYNQYLNKSM